MAVRFGGTLALLSAVCAILPVPAAAQALSSGPNNIRISRFDIFGGYSYINPVQANVGTANTIQPMYYGGVGSVAGYFNDYLGVQAEGTYHTRSTGTNSCIQTAQAGPILRYQVYRFVPFIHMLGGGARVGGPDQQPCTWGYGVTGGLGIDYVLHSFNDHLAVRVIQADYNYNHVDFGPLVAPGNLNGGILKMNAWSAAAGLTLRLGDTTERYAAQLACTATPTSVFSGEPVVIASSNTGLSPKKPTTYLWTTTGGKLSGSGDTVQISTEGIAPGNYTVNGRVSQGRRGYQQATCNADFEIKPLLPPTVTCSANPTTVQAGETSTITAVGVSPSGRPLSYNYTASAGVVTGQGPTATLNSGGAPPGNITVNCNLADDKGQSATSSVAVNVIAVPVPEKLPTRQLCTIDFSRDLKRPARVNNEAKGCLDDIALTLQREGESKLVMVGNGEAQGLAAERAANAKLYLTREKGIDSSRISLRTGETVEQTVANTLVPAGAVFDEASSVEVTESSVQHHGEAYGVRNPSYTTTPRRAPRRR